MARARLSQGTYELHEHSYISGPLAHRSPGNRLTHSHEEGSQSHRHPDVGPATFTIDRDEWFHQTHMQGGGRKEYSREPSGLQLPCEPYQLQFTVIWHPGYRQEDTDG